jgi:hypothetical protein
MTTNVDIVNRALISLGIQKKISNLAQDSVEAQAASAFITILRDELLRMAPWNCAMNTMNLIYITSTPGTPENTSPATTLWQPGQPAPPWAYEYQYPVDCLRPCWLIPGTQTGFAGIPITTAVTGGAPSFWTGQPIKFKVAIDQFFPVISAVYAAQGTQYAVGDIVTLAAGPTTSPPIGAPLQVLVTSVGTVGGFPNSVTGFSIIPTLNGGTTGGSYFKPVTGIQQQGSTTGVGASLAFTLTFDTNPQSQRVILTNQEFATLSYIKQVTDPNIMDPLFQNAWVSILAARLALVLKEDKTLANIKVQESNGYIAEARKADGNEGLIINDVTPDWIRVRGVSFTEWYSGPYSQIDWGPMWNSF